jgi:DNA-binding NarL/FixJ family response regulator
VSAAPSLEPAVRVLLVDDDSSFLALLDSTLAGDPRIEVIGRAGDGQEAVWLAEALQPDVIVMELAMPLFDGVWATARIHAAQPAIGIVGLTRSASAWEAERARRAGMCGVVLRDQALRGLADLLVSARLH